MICNGESLRTITIINCNHTINSCKLKSKIEKRSSIIITVQSVEFNNICVSNCTLNETKLSFISHVFIIEIFTN